MPRFKNACELVGVYGTGAAEGEECVATVVLAPFGGMDANRRGHVLVDHAGDPGGGFYRAKPAAFS